MSWKLSCTVLMGLRGGDTPWLPDHGRKTLSNVLAGLMLLAFLIDQCLEALNLDFKKIFEKMGSRIGVWQAIRSMFQLFWIESWEALYAGVLDPPRIMITAA